MLARDHWSGRVIDFLSPYLQKAQNLIRIATGFFSIQGYNLIRRYLSNKTVYILVGYDETSKERLRDKLIDDIMAHLSRWDEQNRREAVLDLVGKLQRGEFRIIDQDNENNSELLDARIRRKDHAKVYIFDHSEAVVGSSNLTLNGLLYNDEALAAVEANRLNYWEERFQEYWDSPNTLDLTQALLDALLQWLKLRKPYDVYLKTIQALVPEDATEAPRASYKMPVKFQTVVVERVLRQLQDWRGAMLVASTGLGKTVMATHVAYRLRLDQKVHNVLVFAPKQIIPDWETHLNSAGINYQPFTRNLLDRRISSKHGEGRRMLDALAQVDEKYLIIVDESQYFRNQERNQGGKRTAFNRLVRIVNEKNPFIILLTATPYAKEVNDLNNQLYLLPHNSPANHIRSKDGQIALDGFADLVLEPTAWRVQEADHFFEDFMNLPPSTVISTSSVAKNFAVHTEEGDYIDFGEERRWLPRIELQTIKVPLPLEKEMSEALDGRFFKHKLQTFMTRGKWSRTEAKIEDEAAISWASSPSALREVLQKTIVDAYKVEFVKSLDDRKRKLEPILEQLNKMTYLHDHKFLVLVEYLERCHSEGRKVVIFTERQATAIYLEHTLAQVLPELRVANVVQETADGEYKLKNFELEVFDLILDFAPEANRDKIADGRKTNQYDVFISTDAYGAGVNLQDASVIISYDLAWTPDTIIQRAGRILRFWSKPRKVSLYIFVGSFEHQSKRQKQSQRVEERLHRLAGRTEQAEKFSELPIFKNATYDSMGILSQVAIENTGWVDISQIEEFSGVSPFLQHITELNQHLEYAKGIPDDISSAKAYSGNIPLIYLLIRYNRDYHWTVYNPSSQRLLDKKEDELLNLIRCSQNEPVAIVDPDTIEQHAQACKQIWCQEQGIDHPEDVERICALYLVPKDTKLGVKDVLAGSVAVS